MADTTKTCQECSAAFAVSDLDREFYEKMTVPEPTLCPDCRQQRRLAVRNERCIYPDDCDLCGKKMVSLYSPDKEFSVYCYDCWLSDWSRLQYGFDYDFSRPFFEQFKELFAKVPRINIYQLYNENCDYSNYTGYSRNCYLCYGSMGAEDCYYGNPYESKNCVDCFLVRESELCYECVDCEKLYSAVACQNCVDCNDIAFCYDCRGCRNCVGCVGLRNKQYCFFNEQLSEKDFKVKKSAHYLASRKNYVHLMSEFSRFLKGFPRKFARNMNSENSTGNYLVGCKDCDVCFDLKRCRDCKYCAQVMDGKDCMDCNYTERPELNYEHIGYCDNNMCRFGNTSGKCYECFYTEFCTSCKNCFGCVGMQRKEYCILNKQYTKEEYEALLPRIIEHMKSTGEWGEYFPICDSAFTYNETAAQDYYPIDEETARAKGWKWKSDALKDFQAQSCQVADDIREVPHSICEEILACEKTGRNFRVIPQELAFYKRLGLPVPKFCPDERYLARLRKRNPRKLWSRTCMQCNMELYTSYDKSRPEKVFCEDCYLESIY
jgi:hypothetical protein